MKRVFACVIATWLCCLGSAQTGVSPAPGSVEITAEPMHQNRRKTVCNVSGVHRLKFALILLALSIALGAPAQTKKKPAHKGTKATSAATVFANDVSTEPHHKLLFENAKTRVFHVELPAGGSTDLHTHTRDYLIIAISAVHAHNGFETKGKQQETALSMSPGELEVVKVPQTAKLVNDADAPLDMVEVEIHEGFHPDLIVCGLGKRSCPSDVGDIQDPSRQFTINALFETEAVRVRDIEIDAGSTTPERVAKNGYVRLAVTPLNITMGAGQTAKLQPGDVQWGEAGDVPTMTNHGNDAARFYEIEFK
jgi:quercetin dioxygenase-like cupin family protein